MSIQWLHDPVIHKLTQTIAAPQPYPHQDTYLFLISSIISQQLSTKVARVIYERFRSLFPQQYPTAELVLQVEAEKLRSVGLSAQKATYIQEIARFHLELPLDIVSLHALSDEEVIKLLTQIKGVGRWTAQMVLMFPMDRPDVFPIDDLGIQQSMIHFYGVMEKGKELKKRLEAIAQNWQPHRTLACKYLWKARDLQIG